MKKYYLHNGTKQNGPFDVSDLKDKGIKPKTEVWHEGLTDWTTADQVDELKTIFLEATPPPINQQNKADQANRKNKQNHNKTGKVLLAAGLVAVGLFALYILASAFMNYNSNNSSTYYEQKMTIGEIEDADPIRFLNANGKYNESFWGTKLKIRGEIENIATVADYKDVTIKVTYYSKTNSVLTTKNYTLYEVYKPTSVTPFRLDIENFKDVDRIGWEVISALPN